ncbi:hypothetical protein PPL_09127 [Heterostelium album PN500]|uniref:Uncharacterized protein n=1 Tax=Heterostelium pallidum (strain ATCC 26659 / Pp 5 / PN500) TaxID=670386 RepID=D3BKP5_HETP5|nr:hypothetical protein PPL_09127 [Heterostelium album PN500]EFA78475.1 hypothetical protein PPL_09127 [Heterostelium album PN500]|eukprot:XP_020430599.1 hypothetical protein PPL_09127 [Heterostelium album PN500]
MIKRHLPALGAVLIGVLSGYYIFSPGLQQVSKEMRIENDIKQQQQQQQQQKQQ